MIESTITASGRLYAREPDRCTGFTPSGAFPPNLVNIGGGSGSNMSSNGTGNVVYHRPGIGTPEVPTPGFLGIWHFPDFNVGGIDYAGDCAENRARCLVVGDGTITIHTARYGADRLLSAILQHREIAGIVTDQSQSGIPAGDDIVFNVSTHDQTYCDHWVDVRDDGPACGDKTGFAGFDWAALPSDLVPSPSGLIRLHGAVAAGL